MILQVPTTEEPTTTTTLPELDPVPSLTVPDLTATTRPTSTTAVASVPSTDPPSSGGETGGGFGTDLQLFLLIGAFLLVAVALVGFTVRYWQRTRPA